MDSIRETKYIKNKPAMQVIGILLCIIFARVSGAVFISGNTQDLYRENKNTFVAPALELLSSAVDAICPTVINKKAAPSVTRKDISSLKFQFVTKTQNYSAPLLKSSSLWKVAAFKKNKKVVILATGWGTNVNTTSTTPVLNAFLIRNDVNFVLVDSASLIDTLYTWAALNTEDIGKFIARGLLQLVKLVPLKNIHIIGHSLGAHIAGVTGRTFFKMTGHRLPHITGLDPAKPCFEQTTLIALNANDARFVDVIHTNVGLYGIRQRLGTVDFYAGGFQSFPPGCTTMSCAHQLAMLYYAESVYPQNSRHFIAYKCNTLQQLQQLECRRDKKVVMGYNVPTTARGIFYVPVNAQPPYSKNR